MLGKMLLAVRLPLNNRFHRLDNPDRLNGDMFCRRSGRAHHMVEGIGAKCYKRQTWTTTHSLPYVEGIREMLRILCCVGLIILSLASSTAIAGKHYTARLGDRDTFAIDVKTLVFSPDSSQLLVATSQGTYIVQPQGANLLGKIEMSPFSMNYSRDGSRAFLIGTRSRTLFDMRQGVEIEYSSESVPGFIGLTLARQNGKLIISSISPGSPCAENGEIHVGDELVSVGEGSSGSMRSIEGETVKRAIELIKGPAGTHVRLGVIAIGEIHENTYQLQRLAMQSTNGTYVYMPSERTDVNENVVWSISGENHRFRSAKTGKDVAFLRPQNLPWKTGQSAISPDSQLFAWVSEYIDPPKDAVVKDNAKVRDKMAVVYEREFKEFMKKARSGGGGAGRATVGSVKDDVISGSPHVCSFGVEIYNIPSRKMVASFPLEGESVNTAVSVPAFYGVQFSSDGKRLVVGTWSRIHVYDIASGMRVNVIFAPEQGGSRAVNDFAVSDNLAAIADVNGNLRLLDLDSGRVVEDVDSREKDKDAEGLTFSQDGKWLAYVAGKVLHVLEVSDIGGSRDEEHEETNRTE